MYSYVFGENINLIMVAELWAVRDDLALLFGFASLIVEIDSRFVFNAFCKKQVKWDVCTTFSSSASLWCTVSLSLV